MRWRKYSRNWMNSDIIACLICSSNRKYSSISDIALHRLKIEVSSFSTAVNQPLRRYQEYEDRNRSSSKSAYHILAIVLACLVNCSNAVENSVNTDKYNSNRNQELALSRNFIADVVESVLPTVVNIVCSNHSSFVTTQSSGSGFIISNDGFIVTNEHVISSSSDGKVIITLSNQRKVEGYIHSRDARSDIALVQINPNSINGLELQTATLGNSNQVRIGEFCIALGSPLTLRNTVTHGIISALDRHGSELGMSKSRNDYIQTDASINVGNSGGPLVNLDGEVIGINVLKAQGVDGISFAIPMDTAKPIIQQLRLNRKVLEQFII